VKGGDKQNLLKLKFVVAYLESAKIYIDPKKSVS